MKTLFTSICDSPQHTLSIEDLFNIGSVMIVKKFNGLPIIAHPRLQQTHIPVPTTARPPETPTMPPPPSHLMTLPTELHLSIISHLEPFPCSMLLRLVNTHFHNLLDPLTYQQMLAAEKTAHALLHEVFACHKCRRLRPGRRFNEYERHVCVRGCKHREERTCIECNIRSFYESVGK